MGISNLFRCVSQSAESEVNSLNVHATEVENHQGQEYPNIISGSNQMKLRGDESWTDVNLNEDMQEKGKQI